MVCGQDEKVALVVAPHVVTKYLTKRQVIGEHVPLGSRFVGVVFHEDKRIIKIGKLGIRRSCTS